MAVVTEALCRTVQYEIEMLEFLNRKLSELHDTKVGTGSDPEEDAYLESFLLHTRILRDFFFSHAPPNSRTRTCPACKHTQTLPAITNDDILAGDFVPGWNEPEDPYLKTLREPLNKMLAHLTETRERYKLQSYLWDHTAIHQALEPVIAKFRSSLTSQTTIWFRIA